MESKTVLIVDDKWDNRVVYSMFFEHLGYAVVQAVNGLDGVEKARQHKPDLILMDIAMPVMDGLGATALLKEDTLTADIPVLGITAYTSDELRTQALSLGFDDLISKPISPQQLYRTLQHYLNSNTLRPVTP